MNHFTRHDNALFCEDVPLEKIAAEVGTPTYVYSSATLRRHFDVFDAALAPLKRLICYSVKANSNLAVLRLLLARGAGADIVSGGELLRVLKAGGSASKIVFSGVGKTDEEIRTALGAGVLAFNVESEAELEVIAQVAAQVGKRAPIAFRVNPDVDPQTHPYISTGLKNNKFGVAMESARSLYQRASKNSHLDIVGVDCHIGSQLTKTAPFADATARLVELVLGLAGDGIKLRYIDIGGGLGIPYGKDEEPTPPSPAEYGQALQNSLKPLMHLDPTIICEPGRVIVGNAGVLLTRVVFDKPTETKRFMVVDAAMNDLMRPSFYGSFHPMAPVVEDLSRRTCTVDVVGPICESGDFLAKDRELPQMNRGELLSIGAAGAYGFTMSSNYNTRRRCAEVMVDGAEFAVVRERETYEQLLQNEIIPEFAGRQ